MTQGEMHKAKHTKRNTQSETHKVSGANQFSPIFKIRVFSIFLFHNPQRLKSLERKMEDYKKTISFGKIKYYGSRAIYPVDIIVQLRRREINNHEVLELSICGDIWNSKKTDVVCAGQCIDEIRHHVISTKKVSLEDIAKINSIYEIWQRYHLNTMRSGVEAQEKFIKQHIAELIEKARNTSSLYTESKKMLEENNLLKVFVEESERWKCAGGIDENGFYEYGHGWVTEEIPEDIINKIKNW